MTPSILAVIVLYRMEARASASAVSLADAANSADPAPVRLRVILFDNSSTTTVGPGMFREEEYVTAGKNLGLAYAYNAGLWRARELGFDWLLTLDQDTSLPSDFLAKLARTIDLLGSDAQVAAIVPHIYGSGKTLSPYTYRWGAFPTMIPSGFSGVPSEAVYALNSASVFRVSALRQAGGYDPRFWLDGSDHAIFHALAAYGKRVYVAEDVEVHHVLSLIDKEHAVSSARYDNVLGAESAFWDLKMGWLARVERNGRLLLRMLLQLGRGDLPLAGVSRRHLWRRIFRARRYRLGLWERGLLGQAHEIEGLNAHRPRVSVCMAAYNGERYIEEQIRSILPQLAADDEVVVVDDASSDSTRDLIRSFMDPRIRLIVQAENRGVVETFEHSVRSAVGDILFLCDGDDVWAADKVDKVLSAFALHPSATVVCTGLSLIDQSGMPIDAGAYLKHRRFTSALLANLIRNQFQGSAMAFRSQLLRSVLPFPRGKLFLHDAWIGLCNAMAGGEAVYLDQPLLYYRRHSNNASQTLKPSGQMLKRLQLAVALAAHWLKLKVVA